MDKRYQVFVSSTFEDLREERAAVISALLQIDCFPAGMELFPAADDDSLTLIKSVIDDSDYYLVILGGRYGTLDAPGGKSYTHLEYGYALSAGKPTIALLHSHPSSLPAERTERTDDGQKRFEEFAAELKRKNCRYWKDRGELTTAVFTGVLQLKKTRPALGWTRSSDTSDEALKDELLRVRREAESLSMELAEVKIRNTPAGVESLEQGADVTSIAVEFSQFGAFTYDLTWDEIVRSVLPLTFGGGAQNSDIAGALVGIAHEQADRYGVRAPDVWEGPVLSRSSFGKVINQMVALGLIEGRPHPNNAPVTMWVATPYGIKEGSRFVALKRPTPVQNSFKSPE